MILSLVASQRRARLDHRRARKLANGLDLAASTVVSGPDAAMTGGTRAKAVCIQGPPRVVLANAPAECEAGGVGPYEEIVEFIASLSPREVVEFKPSETARQRVWDLLGRQKSAPLPADEKAELDHYLELEHLMRLAKARARQLLGHEQRG